ncbi:MAG: hypothetical protein MK081_12115 [Flavobacteriales bacterium]|nr:hypothetical protein [Flavobacteriales bacterium]
MSLRLLSFYGAFLFSGSLLAQEQGFAYLNWADLHANAGIRSVTEEQIFYKNDVPVDTCLVSRAELDGEGRPVIFENYFACGRLFSREEITYTSDSTLITYACVPTRWETSRLEVTQDDQGRIKTRTFNGAQAWKDEFVYADDGNIVKAIRYQKRGEQWQPIEIKKFLNKREDKEHRAENNLTYIHDQQGLLLIHNVYSNSGQLTMVRKYSYEFEHTVSE